MEEFERLKRRFESHTEKDEVPLQINWDNEEQYDAEEAVVKLKG